MCSLGGDLPREEGTRMGVWVRVVPEGMRLGRGGRQPAVSEPKSPAPSLPDHTHREDGVKGEGTG